MFGGSTMRGCTDDDAKTLPSIVARTLNAGPTNGRAYSAVNFGVDSFNSLLETKYLQKALIEEPGDPDLVVFYDGANDSTYLSELRTPYAHHGYRRVRGLIESYRNRKLGILKPLNAAVYASFTKEALDKLTSVTDRIAPDSRLLADYLDLTEKRYDHVARVAAAYGAEFVLFWQPLLWVETGSVEARVKEEEWGYTLPADRFPAFRSNVLLVNQSVAERLADKPYFVDFRNALCGRTQTVYCADGVHLRDAGRELVGLAMADVIRDRLRQRASAIPAVPDRPRATEERPPGAPR
jgi:lysophospholipase L1-like esterase